MLLTSWLRHRRVGSRRVPAEQHRGRRRTTRRSRLERLEDRLCLSGGYLLVSDYDTNSVLRYDEATGAFVDAFVPKHSGGLNQPQGLVFGPHDGNLYVASGELSPSDQHTAVLRYDGATGAFLDEFANSGHIRGPHAVIFGPDGHLYVAQGLGSEGQVVRYDGITGEFIDDFIPSNSGGLARPFALVFGPSGPGRGKLDLYVVSRLTDSIKHYDGTTGAYLGDFVGSGSGGLDDPIGLTFGPDGNLYVSAGFGTAPSAVFRFQGPNGRDPGAPMPSDGNSGAVFVASGTGGLLTTFGLIFGPDGNGDDQQDLYLPSFELAGSNKAKAKTATIKRFDGVTGAFIDTFVTANSGGLDQPNYVIFTDTDPVTLAYTGAKESGSADPSSSVEVQPQAASYLRGEVLEERILLSTSYLLVADFNRDTVMRYDGSTGAFVDGFVPKHYGGMNQPWGVLFGPDANSDGQRDLYVSTGEFGGPGQLKAVLRYDGTTGEFIDNFAVGGDLASPRGIIFGPDGNLYVADRKYIGQDWQLEGRVARFNGTTGAYMGDFVPIGSGGLSVPTQLVFGPSVEDPHRLDLYVVSTGSDSVLRYHGTTGTFLGEFLTSGSGDLQGPVTMTFRPNGDLLVADFYSSDLAVKRFQGPSGPTPGEFIDTFVPAGRGGLRAPSGLIFGPDGNADGQLDLYVAEVAANGFIKASVKRYDGVTGDFIDTFVAERSGGLEGAVLLTFTDTDPVTLAYTGATESGSADLSFVVLDEKSSGPVWTGTAVDAVTISSLLSSPILVGPNLSGPEGAYPVPTSAGRGVVEQPPLGDLAAETDYQARIARRAEVVDQAITAIVTHPGTSSFGFLPELDCDIELLVDLALASQLA